MTNCWNSARDKNGNRFKGVKLLDRNDISRLEMDKVLLRALRTGDFSEIGLIYNSIVETSCRHTQHTGPLGKKGFNTVSIKDRCSKIEKVVDRREIGKSGSSKKKKEIVVLCGFAVLCFAGWIFVFSMTFISLVSESHPSCLILSPSSGFWTNLVWITNSTKVGCRSYCTFGI